MPSLSPHDDGITLTQPHPEENDFDDFWNEMVNQRHLNIPQENENTNYTQLLHGINFDADVEFFDHIQQRRSTRTRKRTNRYKTQELNLILHVENKFQKEQLFQTITNNLQEEIDILTNVISTSLKKMKTQTTHSYCME